DRSAIAISFHYSIQSVFMSSPLLVTPLGARDVLLTPLFYFGMVATQQYIWYFHTLELCWPSILRSLYRYIIFIKTFFFGRSFAAQHPGKQPYNTISYYHCWDLAASQHIVT